MSAEQFSAKNLRKTVKNISQPILGDSVTLQIRLHPDVGDSNLQIQIPEAMFVRIQDTVGDIFQEKKGIIFAAATLTVTATASAYVLYEAKKRKRNWEINDPFTGFTAEQIQRFGNVYQTHHPMLVQFLSTFEYDRPTAKDIAQETFLRIAPKFPSVIPRDDHKYPYGTYLCKAAMGLALNKERDLNRKGKIEKYLDVHDENDDMIPIDTPFREERSPEAVIIEREDESEQRAKEAQFRQSLLRLMGKLTNEQKTTVWLKFLLERKDEDIATIFQLKVNAIKVRIHRLRKKLRGFGVDLEIPSL